MGGGYISDLEQIPIVQKIEEEDHYLIIHLIDMKIKMFKITDIYISANGDNELGTYDRMGKCHQKSVVFSRVLRKDNIRNTVVTGYAHHIGSKGKYLHSWIEFDIKGDPFVLDYTRNLIISKEGYYFLMHAQPICKINDQEIEDDFHNEMLRAIYPLNIKEYLTFRHEIIRDLNKLNLTIEEPKTK